MRTTRSGYFVVKTAAIFGQKIAARPQGQKKNYVQLRSDQNGQKDAERYIGSITLLYTNMPQALYPQATTAGFFLSSYRPSNCLPVFGLSINELLKVVLCFFSA